MTPLVKAEMMSQLNLTFDPELGPVFLADPAAQGHFGPVAPAFRRVREDQR